MVTIYLHTTYQLFTKTHHLVFPSHQNMKYRLPAATIRKITYFSQVYCHSVLQDPAVHGTNVGITNIITDNFIFNLDSAAHGKSKLTLLCATASII